MESFRKEASEAFQMGISDRILFCIQHGSDHSPVFVFYIYAGYSWRKTGGNRIYVATGAVKIAGVEFTWSLLGYNVLRDASGAVLIGGGLGYFISYEVGSFVAQCINFPAAEKCYI